MGDEIEPPSVPPAALKRKRGRPRKERPPNPFGYPTESHGRPRDFAVPPDALTCEACEEQKPTQKFSRFLEQVATVRAENGDWQLERLCDHCATYGPPLENPLAKLSIRELEALSVLAAGGSMRRAALVLGVDEKQMRSYLAGREKPVIRAAYQKLCLQMGITPEKLAQVIVDALGASRSVYSADGTLIAEIPDHNIRLKAAGYGLKILQLEQPTELSKRSADEDMLLRPTVYTTLGDGKTIEAEGYSFPEMKDVN